MKVLQILGEASWGGRIAGVHATTRAMLHRGYDVHVLTNDEVVASRFELIGAQVVKPPMWFRVLHPLDLVPLLHLVMLCRWTQFDLVASHTSKAGLLGRLAARAVAGEIDPAMIDEGLFAEALQTIGLPDPDLMIRTSGEKRISNFLLWQAAYSELVFLEKYWPDFSKEDLVDAVAEYCRRDRRYGATAESR